MKAAPVSDWDVRARNTAAASSVIRMPEPCPSAAPLVLIVEDEESIAGAVRLILEELGCRAVLAPHGKAALEIIHRERPDLVLTDLMMPVMDGKKLIAVLHDEAQLTEIPPTPMIVMTATGHASASDLRVSAVLRKPFDLLELEEVVTQFLGEQLALAAVARS